MKLYKVVGIIVFIIIVSLTLSVLYIKNAPDTSTKSTIVSNNASSDSNDKLALDSSKHLSDEDIKNIMHKTDSRVKKINDKINYNFYKDYYDGDIPMFRYFNNDMEQESLTEYWLYYDERGKLVYADITHYRGASYSIYYHNDKLLHVEVGPFIKGGLFINGNMANVENVIKKDPSFAFVLEDNSLCLEYGILKE